MAAAAEVKEGLPAIMAQTGHRSVDTVQGYVRRAALFDDDTAEGLLLLRLNHWEVK